MSISYNTQLYRTSVLLLYVHCTQFNSLLYRVQLSSTTSLSYTIIPDELIISLNNYTDLVHYYTLFYRANSFYYTKFYIASTLLYCTVYTILQFMQAGHWDRLCAVVNSRPQQNQQPNHEHVTVKGLSHEFLVPLLL